MSYYNDNSSQRPRYYSSPAFRQQSGYGAPSGHHQPPGYGQDSSYESRGRSPPPPRRESRSSHRSVSPIGASRFERPFEMSRRNPSYTRGASREPLSRHEAPPFSRDEFTPDSRYDSSRSMEGVSSFYSRDPYGRAAPPRRGHPERPESPRRDPVSSRSSRRPSDGPYGVDVSSMGGGYDVSGIYSSSGTARRPSDGPDFSRGSGFAYGYDPGLDGVEPRQSSRLYPPSATGNSYGGGASGSLGGSRRRVSRGYY